MYYMIVETDTGLVAAEVPDGDSAEDVATKMQALTVDPSPYKSFDEAYDAMLRLPVDEAERAKLRE